MRSTTPTLAWGLALLLFGCATTNVTVPEALDDVDPIAVEASDPSTPSSLRAGTFAVRDLETRKAGEPFSFTLTEGEMRRARINCISRVAFVCTGDEGFLFFLRIPSWTEGAVPATGELSVETVSFRLEPQLGEPAPPDGALLGFEIHGPDQLVGALQIRNPGARIWLSPNLAGSLRRAIAASVFALRIYAELRTPPPQKS